LTLSQCLRPVRVDEDSAMSFCSSAVLKCNTKDTFTLLNDDKFIALEEMVTIIPKFSSDHPVDCLKGKFGPFRAHSAAKVPLWMALEMDKQQQCTIELPAWLQEKKLKSMLDEEIKNPERFCEVPEHYVEIAFAFLTSSRTYAIDNRNDKARTEHLLKGLVEQRRIKIARGLKDFAANDEVNVTHLSAIELTCFRTRSLHAMDYFTDLLAQREIGKAARAENLTTEGSSQALHEDSSSNLPASFNGA